MASGHTNPPVAKPKRVLILSLVFPPDGVSTARLLGDISLDLRQAGYEVVVVTAFPHYNRDVEAESTQPIRQLLFGLAGISSFRGIPVHHVFVPGKSSRGITRILQWAWFHVAATLAALAISPRPDLIFATSPPPTVGLSAWILGRVWSIPYILNIWELFPEIAIRLGYLSNETLIRALRWIQHFTYRRARVMTVTSNAMLKSVADNYRRVAIEKLEVVPNFVDLDVISPGSKKNTFSQTHGLSGRFVVSYAGNMGTPQGLDRVLDAAAAMTENEDIHFLLVGGGLEQSRLAAEAERRGLSNCTVMRHQPYSVAPDIYATSDLCLVPLSTSLEAEAIPGKVYQVMAAGRPILALASPTSALADLVTESGSGMVVSSDSGSEIADVVKALAKDTAGLQRMGEAGRSYAQSHFSRTAVMTRYIQILKRIG